MMGALRRALSRLRCFFSKPALDADLEAEIAAHIELAIEENLQRGLDPLEARRQALIRFGGIDVAKHQQREARGLMKLDILLQSLRYTIRTLSRDRGFTIVAILILALGIGANIAVFSVVNTLLLRPLPFSRADQLVWIAPPPTKCGLSCATYSTDAYDTFRVQSRSYQDVTGYFAFSGPGNLSLNRGGAPIPATSIDVIANFFQVLGVQPAMGRAFSPDDARNGAAPVVVLTDAWWRRQFNADPAIVGKAYDINGQQTTVIGVLPKSFDFGAVFSPGAKIDAITPLNLYGPPRDWGNIITFIGRLKPGVSLAQAGEEVKSVAPRMCWNNKNPKSCGDYKDAWFRCRSKTTSAASCGARWLFSGPLSAASCSLPASISRTFFLPAPPPAPRNLPCAPRSAPAGAGSWANCSRRASCFPQQEPSSAWASPLFSSPGSAIREPSLFPCSAHSASTAPHWAGAPSSLSSPPRSLVWSRVSAWLSATCRNR
jgi:hypothetical protein